MKMECCNDKSLSWVQSFTNVINKENCGMPCKPLPPSQLIKIGKLLEDSTAVPLEILIENSDVDIHNGGKIGFIKKILLHFPMMLIDIDSPIIINIWQIDFKTFSPDKSVNDEKANILESPENISGKRKSRSGGRPPVIKEFPTLVQTAAKFIKLHGFSAHLRRRESVGTGKGVSMDDVRQYLLETSRIKE